MYGKWVRIQPRWRLAHSTPHFLFRLAEKKTGRGRSKRKGRFLPRSGAVALRATGVFRAGAGKDCRPSASSRRTAQLSRPCAACPVRRKTGVINAWPLLLSPLPLHGPAREGQRQRLRSRLRLCRLTLDSRSRLRRATDVASPLRVKSAQRVSGASPGRRVPQGPGVSVPGCREGRPTFLRRRQEVRMYADRPAETFFLLTGCDRFLFDVSKRKWGHIGTSRQPG